MKRILAPALLLLFANGCKKNAACRPGSLFLTLSFHGPAAGADELHVRLSDDSGTLDADTPYHGGTTLEVDFPSGRYHAGQPVTLVVSALAAGVELASVEKDGLMLPPSCVAIQLALGVDDDAGVASDLAGLDLAGLDLSGVAVDLAAADLALSANGAACAADKDCDSDHCADGVCCNAACTDQCEACDVDPLVGQCVPVVSGQPHGSRPGCAGTDGGVCGGACSAAARNSCTYPGPATACSTQTCVGNLKSLVSGCDQAGGCSPQDTRTCPMGCVSGGDDCMGACLSDADCAGNPAGLFCDSGVCTPLKPRGHGCATAGECTSGSCADGVCCNNDCTGQCQGCNESGTVGTCVLVTGAVRTASPPPTRTGCTGSGECVGTCNGTSTTCVLPGSGTPCGTQSCTGGVLKPVGGCNLAGGCNQSTMNPCNTNLCNPGGTDCGTCASDGDCGAGKWCKTTLNGGTCLVKAGDGSTCGGDNQCSNGHCVGTTCCHQACGGTTPACSSDGSTCVCSGASCGAGFVCLAAGTCCNHAANCSGKNCGSDSCGGNCGTCGSTTPTCTMGTCVCTVSSCGSGFVCKANGACCNHAANCSGRICGSDSCGGSCGGCGGTTPNCCEGGTSCLAGSGCP